MDRKKKVEEVVEPTCAENAQVEKTEEEMFEELYKLSAEITQQQIAEEKAKVVEEVETPVSDESIVDEETEENDTDVKQILCGDYVEEELTDGECNNDKSAKFIDELYKILDRNVSLDYQFIKMKNEILDLIKKIK